MTGKMVKTIRIQHDEEEIRINLLDRLDDKKGGLDVFTEDSYRLGTVHQGSGKWWAGTDGINFDGFDTRRDAVAHLYTRAVNWGHLQDYRDEQARLSAEVAEQEKVKRRAYAEQRFQRELDSILTGTLTTLTEKTEKFAERVRVDPISVIEWDTMNVLVAAHVVRLVNRISQQIMRTDATTHEAIVAILDQNVTEWTSELVRYRRWEPNSTSPMQNLSNLAEANARAKLIEEMTDLVRMYRDHREEFGVA